jgi:hypothetical protein
MDVRDLLTRAVSLAGSEAKLGKATGYSQHGIWMARKKGRVSPKMAVAIERAVGIPKSALCPDIFPPDDGRTHGPASIGRGAAA